MASTNVQVLPVSEAQISEPVKIEESKENSVNAEIAVSEPTKVEEPVKEAPVENNENPSAEPQKSEVVVTENVKTVEQTSTKLESESNVVESAKVEEISIVAASETAKVEEIPVVAASETAKVEESAQDVSKIEIPQLDIPAPEPVQEKVESVALEAIKPEEQINTPAAPEPEPVKAEEIQITTVEKIETPKSEPEHETEVKIEVPELSAASESQLPETITVEASKPDEQISTPVEIIKSDEQSNTTDNAQVLEAPKAEESQAVIVAPEPVLDEAVKVEAPVLNVENNETAEPAKIEAAVDNKESESVPEILKVEVAESVKTQESAKIDESQPIAEIVKSEAAISSEPKLAENVPIAEEPKIEPIQLETSAPLEVKQADLEPKPEQELSKPVDALIPAQEVTAPLEVINSQEVPLEAAPATTQDAPQ